MHHDAIGLRRGFLKDRLQHMQHEIHRRVVVVEQDDLILRRVLFLGVDALLDGSIGLVLTIGHNSD